MRRQIPNYAASPEPKVLQTARGLRALWTLSNPVEADHNRLVVIVNLAGYRVAGPSGRVYSLVALLEPGEQFVRHNARLFIVRRLFVLVILIPATLFLLFCCPPNNPAGS